MKLSLGVKVETKFVLLRREMCTLSFTRTDLRICDSDPVP